MAQYARPDSTVSAGNWLGNSTTIHGDTSDIDNSTYAYMAFFGSSTCEVGLSNVTDPSDDTNHVVYFSGYHTDIFGGGNLTVGIELLQGSTSIKQQNHSITNTNALYTTTLSTSEASNITDYTDLRFRFTAGSANYAIEVSHARFEVPDAASPPPPPPPPPSSNFIEMSNAQFRIEGLTNLGG